MVTAKTFNTADDIRLFDFSTEGPVDCVQSLGFVKKGVASGLYIRNGHSPDVSKFVGPNIISADGSIWELSTTHLTPKYFGALTAAENIHETISKCQNTKALNMFFNYIASNDVGTAFISGFYEVDGELFLGKEMPCKFVTKDSTDEKEMPCEIATENSADEKELLCKIAAEYSADEKELPCKIVTESSADEKELPGKIAAGDSAEEKKLRCIIDYKVSTQHIVGSPVFALDPDSCANILFTIHGFDHSQWDGRIKILGKRAGQWVDRNINHGVLVSGCFRSVFGGFICENIAGYGVYCSSEHYAAGNCNFVSLGNCRFIYCGSGSNRGEHKDKDFMHTKFGNPTQIYDRRFLSIDVEKIPNSDLLPNVKQRPLLLDGNNDKLHFLPEGKERIAGQKIFDRENKKIIVTPAIDTERGETLKWVFGGGIRLQGSDVGGANIDSIDATSCAITLDIGAEYGPNVRRISNHNCFTAVNATRRSKIQVSTTNIGSIYAEGNYCYWSRVGGSYTNINGFCDFDFDKDIPRLGEYPDTFIGMNVSRNGKYLAFEKKGMNGSERHSRIDLLIDNQNIVRTYKKDSIVLELDIDKGANKAFGYDSAYVTILGSGDNYSPTGNISLRCKNSEDKINGLTELNLNNFSGPAILTIYYDFRESNFCVGVTNGA